MKKGYVIRNQYNEMISHVVVGSGSCSWGWTLSPDFAKVYSSETKAIRHARVVDSDKYYLNICSFLETKTQFIVGKSFRPVGVLASIREA